MWGGEPGGRGGERGRKEERGERDQSRADQIRTEQSRAEVGEGGVQCEDANKEAEVGARRRGFEHGSAKKCGFSRGLGFQMIWDGQEKKRKEKRREEKNRGREGKKKKHDGRSIVAFISSQ